MGQAMISCWCLGITPFLLPWMSFLSTTVHPLPTLGRTLKTQVAHRSTPLTAGAVGWRSPPVLLAPAALWHQMGCRRAPQTCPCRTAPAGASENADTPCQACP